MIYLYPSDDDGDIRKCQITGMLKDRVRVLLFTVDTDGDNDADARNDDEIIICSDDFMILSSF